MNTNFEITRQQVTATARKLTAKWTVELETMTMAKPINVMKSERKGFKHQIKISYHLKWPEVAAWMEHSFGPGGNRKSWSCDWGHYIPPGKHEMSSNSAYHTHSTCI